MIFFDLRSGRFTRHDHDFKGALSRACLSVTSITSALLLEEPLYAVHTCGSHHFPIIFCAALLLVTETGVVSVDV